MKKSVWSILCGVCLLVLPGQALAQSFGKKLDVAFSADRLFGVTFSNVTTQVPGRPDHKVDYSRISFGWGGRAVRSPFEIPRAAVDVFVTDGLSVGGSLGYATVSVDQHDGRNYRDYNTFLLAPRVGYVWTLSPLFGFWLRGGFSYHSENDGSGDSSDEHGFALTVEPTFMLTPTDHFGIAFGPTLDLDLTGEVGSGPSRVDRTQRNIGLLQLGIVGWL